MIATVRGTLNYKSSDYIIVEVGGIGYQIYTSTTSHQALPEIGKVVTLFTYTYIREDALNLYGFLTMEEKELFMLLLNVSGIGPRLSLNILSGMPVGDLANSIRTGDIARLTSIPGIGNKMASRLIFELKEKIGNLSYIGSVSQEDEKSRAERDRIVTDVISALMNLGYQRQPAMDAIKRISMDRRNNLSAEELVKESLKILAK